MTASIGGAVAVSIFLTLITVPVGLYAALAAPRFAVVIALAAASQGSA